MFFICLLKIKMKVNERKRQKYQKKSPVSKRVSCQAWAWQLSFILMFVFWPLSSLIALINYLLLQRRIQNLVKQLRWSYLRNQFNILTLFRKSSIYQILTLLIKHKRVYSEMKNRATSLNSRVRALHNKILRRAVRGYQD